MSRHGRAVRKTDVLIDLGVEQNRTRRHWYTRYALTFYGAIACCSGTHDGCIIREVEFLVVVLT